jgi:hypothetical protein
VERYELRKDGATGFSHPNGTHDDVLWNKQNEVSSNPQSLETLSSFVMLSLGFELGTNGGKPSNWGFQNQPLEFARFIAQTYSRLRIYSSIANIGQKLNITSLLKKAGAKLPLKKLEKEENESFR